MINNLKTNISDFVYSQLPEVLSKYKIDTPLRLAHFLSQCHHESMGFKAVYENLNYSADGLQKTFKKYFSDKVIAEQYQKKPELIASKVYGNRMGNGPETTKEGWKYRGRGYIQLTGKLNYSAFNKVVSENILENPDLVATKYPLLSAAWFWNSRNLNNVADKGSTDEIVKEVTKIVNGGFYGLKERTELFKKYYTILNS